MKNKRAHPLTKLVDAAFRQAAKKVVKRAIEAGTPVVVWEDGEIKKVDPRTIKIGRQKKNHRRRMDDDQDPTRPGTRQDH